MLMTSTINVKTTANALTISASATNTCRFIWLDESLSGKQELSLMQFLLSNFCFPLLNRAMSPLIVGCIAGLIFGAVDVALMLPMSFPDKRTALIAAFLSRFGIGFVIPLVNLPTWPGWLVGVVFGVLLSLPDAVVTKSYAPILIGGAVGGLIIGGITRGWGAR